MAPIGEHAMARLILRASVPQYTCHVPWEPRPHPFLPSQKFICQFHHVDPQRRSLIFSAIHQIGSSRGSINTSLTATCWGCLRAYTIEFATSSASRTFAPEGSPYFLIASASVDIARSSVATLPGCTLVTRRPVPAVSTRKAWSVASTKNLLAEYTPRPGNTFLPASDDIAMMWPLPRDSIDGTVEDRQ